MTYLEGSPILQAENWGTNLGVEEGGKEMKPGLHKPDLLRNEEALATKVAWCVAHAPMP